MLKLDVKFMYIELILASPFARILDPSTTIRCEHIAGEDVPPEGSTPPLPGRSVINPSQGMDWELPASVLLPGLRLEPPKSDGGRKARAFSGSSGHPWSFSGVRSRSQEAQELLAPVNLSLIL